MVVLVAGAAVVVGWSSCRGLFTTKFFPSTLARLAAAVRRWLIVSIRLQHPCCFCCCAGCCSLSLRSATSPARDALLLRVLPPLLLLVLPLLLTVLRKLRTVLVVLLPLPLLLPPVVAHCGVSTTTEAAVLPSMSTDVHGLSTPVDSMSMVFCMSSEPAGAE